MKQQLLWNESDIAGKWRSGVRVGLFASLMLATGLTQVAKADTAYNFSFSGSGISASGVFTVSSTPTLAGYEITSIDGTFTDSNVPFSGAITGLEFAPPPTLNGPSDPPGTFAAPAFTSAGFSYDNLFYPDGNSPAVCADAQGFFGGDLDIYGIVFDVAGAAGDYTVDLWSQGVMGGYFVGDSFDGVKLGPSDGGYPVDFTANAPEPSSLLLLGSGLPGLVALWKRKKITSGR
jgi:hypothetical protein